MRRAQDAEGQSVLVPGYNRQIRTAAVELG